MRFEGHCGILVALMLLVVPKASGADFGASIMGGYNGGVGFRFGGAVSDFAEGFPLSIEAAVSYTLLDPGNPAEARVNFINDATNGTPDESGHRWDYRLDFLYKVKMLGMQDAYLFAGVRHSAFTGNFVYVGGNEDFDVTSSQWGIGLGAKALFPMGRNIAFTLLAGIDNYFAAELTGHDTSYSPDGEDVNGRDGYTYETADDAIEQPKVVPVIMIGVTYGL